MELAFFVHGMSCDLALHPISAKTAQKIQDFGPDVYSMKPLRWWTKGNTSTWGMRIGDGSHVEATLDGDPIAITNDFITAHPVMIRRRMFLDSKAKYLCVLGFDNEMCKSTWKWSAIQDFDPAKLQFVVHQWDRIMGEPNYFILDDILYDGKFADKQDMCDAEGFTLIAPRIIDLDEVRRELAHGAPEHKGSPFPSPNIAGQTASA